MPKISQHRDKELDKLEPVLDVLNHRFSSSRIIEEVEENESVNPIQHDPELDYLYINAEYRLRGNLLRWVEEWLTTRPPSPRDDREDYVCEYLYANQKLRAEFDRITRAWGIKSEIFRELLAFQPVDNISGNAKFKSQVRTFRYFFEDVRALVVCDGKEKEVQLGMNFLNSDDPLLGAEAEAMRLFILLLRSPFSGDLRKCGLKGCERYFLNIGGRRRFCSRQHAQAKINLGVLKQLEKKRKQKKKAALSHAAKAIRKLKSTKDWKRRIAKQTGLTLHFITRNLRAGILRAPKEAR